MKYHFDLSTILYTGENQEKITDTQITFISLIHNASRKNMICKYGNLRKFCFYFIYSRLFLTLLLSFILFLKKDVCLEILNIQLLTPHFHSKIDFLFWKYIFGELCIIMQRHLSYICNAIYHKFIKLLKWTKFVFFSLENQNCQWKVKVLICNSKATWTYPLKICRKLNY